jgi:hypothetical protein
MSDIEKIKEQLAMKYMAGKLNVDDIEFLPKNNEIRTLICSFSSFYAYLYAHWVDRGPNDETRSAACKEPWDAFDYACYVDGKPTGETRIAACKDPYCACCYAYYVDRKPMKETRAAVEKSLYRENYQKWEKDIVNNVRTFLKEKFRWIIKQFLKWPEQR